MFEISNATVAEGCVITQPGQYRLVEDISWEARDPNARAISIECDDVTVDLRGHLLRQVNTPTPVIETDPAARACRGEVVSGNVGIWAFERKGVTVKHGRVQNIQGVGVCMKNCQHVDLIDLNIRGCGGDGVIDTSFLCRNGGLFVMGTLAAQPEATVWSSDIRILDCICTDNTSMLDFVVTLGCLVQHTENIEVRGCVFNRNFNGSPEPSGVQFNVVGIDFVQCRNVLCEDCEAHDNRSGGEAAGFFAWGDNYKFVRCRANRNTTSGGHRACGFNISTTVNLEVIDCEANNNYNNNPAAASDKVRDFAACGFRIGRAVKNAVLENCTASGNYSIGKNAPVAGFMMNSTVNTVLKNCKALANRSATGNKGGLAWAAGFLASKTQSTPDGDLWGGECNTFINCTAEGNTVNRVPVFEQPPYPQVDKGIEVSGDLLTCAGFIIDNQHAAKIIDCIATNNQGQGIWIHNSGNAIVEGNYVAGNAAKGIRDETPTCKNLFAGNKLRLNGNGPADNLQVDEGTSHENSSL